MANTSRRYIDKTGKMFIPMNVEGGSWTDHFITTPKLVCIFLIALSAFFIYMTLKDANSPFISYVLFFGVWFIISLYITRFIIFEEKYYYRMYKQLKESEISTPAVFWDIASINDKSDGAILRYSDGKIGIIVRLERDTITGKPPEFKETHYDAISDFYKEMMLRRYSFVQINMMEQAGNDPRLEELNKLIYTDSNPNIKRLMELQVGYIKNITHHTLYESDYILFYTNDISRIDHIIDECVDIIYKILDGAYIGYRVLRARDIVEFVKEEYGVKYFNYTEATLDMFRSHGVSTKMPFEVSQIIYADGDIQDLKPADVNKINKLASDVMNGTVDITNLSIKDTLWPISQRNINKNDEIYDTLSQGFTARQRQQAPQRNSRRTPPFGRNKPAPSVNPVREVQTQNGQIDFALGLDTEEEQYDSNAQLNYGNTPYNNQQQQQSDDGFDFGDAGFGNEGFVTSTPEEPAVGIDYGFVPDQNTPPVQPSFQSGQQGQYYDNSYDQYNQWNNQVVDQQQIVDQSDQFDGFGIQDESPLRPDEFNPQYSPAPQQSVEDEDEFVDFGDDTTDNSKMTQVNQENADEDDEFVDFGDDTTEVGNSTRLNNENNDDDDFVDF